MCYAIPGKIIKLEGERASVDYFGETREALANLFEVNIGDYVYAQGGVIIEKLHKAKAEEIISLWHERFEELKKVDKSLSKKENTFSENTNDDPLLEAIKKSAIFDIITRDEIKGILNSDDGKVLDGLVKSANRVRQELHDNACCVHGIIEFSNYCTNDCHYCGINKSASIERYRMSVDEIVVRAKYARDELNFKAIVLQSGEDAFYTEEKLTEIVDRIKNLGVLIFLSIGVRSVKTYENLYKAGARAVLLRFETSNRETFTRLRPGTSFEERIILLKELKRIGYQMASGFLIGLPGETDDDLINNILLAKELKTDMYSIGPFIPAIGTPLEKEKKVDYEKVIKTIALTRLIDKNSKILVTSALETLNKKGKKEGLLAGANSLMLNVTEPRLKELYSLYPGRVDKDKEIKEDIDETVKLLTEIGRAPSDIGL